MADKEAGKKQAQPREMDYAAPKEGIRLEEIVNGHRVFRGPLLLAVVNTKHDQGMKDKTGSVHYEDMDPADWRIHFTSPEMAVKDLTDVVDNLPKSH